MPTLKPNPQTSTARRPCTFPLSRCLLSFSLEVKSALNGIERFGQLTGLIVPAATWNKLKETSSPERHLTCRCAKPQTSQTWQLHLYDPCTNYIGLITFQFIISKDFKHTTSDLIGLSRQSSTLSSFIQLIHSYFSPADKPRTYQWQISLRHTSGCKVKNYRNYRGTSYVVIQNDVAPQITMLWIPPNIVKLYMTRGEHFNGWSTMSFCPPAWALHPRKLTVGIWRPISGNPELGYPNHPFFTTCWVVLLHVVVSSFTTSKFYSKMQLLVTLAATSNAKYLLNGCINHRIINRITFQNLYVLFHTISNNNRRRLTLHTPLPLWSSGKLPLQNFTTYPVGRALGVAPTSYLCRKGGEEIPRNTNHPNRSKSLLQYHWLANYLAMWHVGKLHLQDLATTSRQVWETPALAFRFPLFPTTTLCMM